MPDELEYIVNDAICQCDKGAKPNYFKSTYNMHVKIMGCLAATRVDKIPIVNIPEFGVCAVSGGPCVPAPIEWLDTYKLKVKGEETLLYMSTLPCSIGGIVEFITSGQIPISPEELAAMIDANSEEQPPIEETVMEEVEVEEEVDDPSSDEGLSWWDGAEMIPFVGGVIGTVRSGSKGDWTGVGLSVASFGLDVGGLFSFGAGNGASAVVKGGKLARVGFKAAKAVNKGRKVIKVLKQVPKVVLKAAPKLLTKAGAKALAKSLATKVDDIAKATGKICVFACFPAGTLVNTEHGQIPIEQIKTGDKVWAFDEDSSAIELKEVLQTTTRECDHTIELYTAQETIETTAEHPFYTTEGWKDAADLEPGDKIITQNDETVEITETKFYYEPKQVYNFEVADWHSYFVGALAWLVHNTAPGKCLTKIVIAAKNKIKRNLLNKPKKRGQAPTFKSDGTSVEIHHVGQNPKGPFKELHWKDHRGKGVDKINHPNKSKPSKVDRKEFDKQKREYWNKEFDNWK
jgi:hypothetical protein